MASSKVLISGYAAWWADKDARARSSYTCADAHRTGALKWTVLFSSFDILITDARMRLPALWVYA